jgi:hypothetical protein
VMGENAALLPEGRLFMRVARGELGLYGVAWTLCTERSPCKGGAGRLPGGRPLRHWQHSLYGRGCGGKSGGMARPDFCAGLTLLCFPPLRKQRLRHGFRLLC